uniref:Tail protein n=1 Tax=viral metagenome TaxID=1070528 RepID=A0A6M3KAQ7_9ZZZZ
MAMTYLTDIDNTSGGDTFYTGMVSTQANFVIVDGYLSEIVAGRDSESTLLARSQAITAAIAALTVGTGCPVSADDTTPGYLDGKLLAGEGIDFTVGSPAANETLTISGEDASATNKGIVELATDAETQAGTDTTRAVTPAGVKASVHELIKNLKPVVNVSVNKLDIFTKTGGAVPDASNIIYVAIPDGNGYTFRSRAAAYLSGTSQFVMADAANYWSKGSLDAEIKTAWVYAIWDGTGIVWALAGYSGFNMVPTTTTVTDDDYFLLEAGSTYTRSNSHYCVAVCKIRYEYDTGDTPDHTIQATVENSPRVIWNPRSDYGYSKNLVTTNSSGADIAEYSAVSVIAKQAGKYAISAQAAGVHAASVGETGVTIKTGSATYASAVLKSNARNNGANYASTYAERAICKISAYVNNGDTIHLGAYVTAASGTRILYGDSDSAGATSLTFFRID